MEASHGAMASYLGIDASLEGTGLGLVSDDGIVILRTLNPRGLRGITRLAFIKAETIAFLPQASLLGKGPIAGAAVEGYAYNAVNQAFSLGEVGGVLRLVLHEHGIGHVDVPPASLKKYATGSSDADKDAMIAAAIAAGASPGDDNQADGYFLARIALALGEGHVYGRPRERAKLEVIRSLTNPAPRRTRRRPRRLVENPV